MMRLMKPTSLLAAGLLVVTVGCSGATVGGEGEGEGEAAEGEGEAAEGEGEGEAAPGLVINEVAAAGDPLDWVELKNTSDVAVNLSGLYLTDNLDEPQQGALPAVSVGAGELYVVEIDDTTLGFKLGSDEEVHLVNSNGDVIDGVDWDEGDSPAGGSFARGDDGNFSSTTPDTRGADNG